MISRRIKPYTTYLALVTMLVAHVTCAFPIATCQAEDHATMQVDPGISGLWQLEGGTIEVEIKAADGKANGVIVHDSAPAPTEPPAHPVIGWQIFQNFIRDTDGTWNGRMFNVRNGNDYACWMRLEAPDRLIVRPYKGISMFGKTHVFLRSTRTAPSSSSTPELKTP